jgi:D-glycero-alpha-D-manno-heptose-7-phosphate kinase
MMFIVPPHRRVAVVRALTAAGASAEGVRFESAGAGSWAVPDSANG